KKRSTLLNMSKQALSIVLGLLCLTFTSCISNKKTVLLQNGGFSKTQVTSLPNKAPAYKLQENDVISIKIKTLDDDQAIYLTLADNAFNQNQISTFLGGYSISDSGYIQLPGVGEVQVGGLTVEEARDRIQNLIRSTALRDASVFVNLVSWRVSVLGEVANPAQFFVYNNQITIMEAVARVGGFDEFADRSQVHLIRQTTRGEDVIKIDMLDASFLTSPYYYLLPNDVIYVPTLEEKNTRSNLATLVIVNTVVSTVSATIAILTLIENRRAAEEE
ncbi:MAG: polysaccharide biosynthesis/export family protein, partial [Bacteroidota bacterium]